MTTWTFGRKLAVGFFAIALLGLTMAGISYLALRSVVEDKDRVLEITGSNLVDAQRLRTLGWQKAAIARAYLLTANPTRLTDLEAAHDEFLEVAARIRGRGMTDEEERLLAAVEAVRGRYRQAINEVTRLRAGDTSIADVAATFDRDVKPDFDTLEASLDDFVAHEDKRRLDGTRASSESAAQAGFTIAAIGLGLVAIAALVGFYLTRSLSRQVGGAVEHVRSSSAELKTTAAQQASGAKEQATAMSEVTTTVSELLANSRQIASSAERVAGCARDTQSAARDGGTTVGKARDSLTGIRRQVDVIVEHMLELGKRSQQAGGILAIVNELADQTNILAINATIEAAGAGEAGRRFAVVADEIRKLADRVGGSTKEIRDLIEEIRSAVGTTVMATESGAKQVEAGASRFDELARAFERIGEMVEETSEAAREIELSTQQQTTAVEQVNVAVANVAQATREAEAAASQTAQTAAELLSLADGLARVVQAPRPA